MTTEIGWAALAVVPSFRDFDRKLEAGPGKALAVAGVSGGITFGKAAAASGSDTFKAGLDLGQGAKIAGDSAGQIGGSTFGKVAAADGSDAFKSGVDLGPGAKTAGDSAGLIGGRAFGELGHDAHGTPMG